MIDKNYLLEKLKYDPYGLALFFKVQTDEDIERVIRQILPNANVDSNSKGANFRILINFRNELIKSEEKNEKI